MVLKTIIASLDDVDEEVRPFYKQAGEQYVLDIEGVDDHPDVKNLKSALERQKEDARKAKEEAKALRAEVEKYKDIDPEKAKEAQRRLEELEDKELLDENKIDELVQRRTQRTREDAEARIKAATTKAEELQQQLEQTTSRLSKEVIDNAVLAAANEAGVRKGAHEDILLRAGRVWSLDDDGKPIARNGDDVLYGKEGSPIRIGEWVESLRDKADYLFEPSRGGSAPGGEQRRDAKTKTVSSENPNAIGDNLEAFASGEARLG